MKHKKGGPVEQALRRLRARSRKPIGNPGEQHRRKAKAARFSAMLSARHADP
jgi:hypothetical protein